ncbi:MAG: WG repeat-containing protein [Hydrococcus sp. Prado102]|jgi:hypothetical protein|nr:WG repeat-containing protein [Hydrococcus sp. Prado102]
MKGIVKVKLSAMLLVMAIAFISTRSLAYPAIAPSLEKTSSAQKVSQFTEGLAAVKVGDKWGYIDTTGKIAIALQYDSVSVFSDGLAQVAIDSEFWYIDKTNKVVIKPQVDSALAFSEGLAEILIGDKFGYMDKTGKIVIAPQFDIALKFSEELALVAHSNETDRIDAIEWGYIDKSGKYIWNQPIKEASERERPNFEYNSYPSG